MIKHLLICLLLTLIIPSYQLIAHSTVVGKVVIENFGKEIWINAILEKQYLSQILKPQHSCSPKDMLLHCGDDYIQRHIQFLVNGNNECVSFESMEIRKSEVLFKYSISPIEEDLDSIGVISDYMLSHDHHAVLRVEVNMDTKSSSYNLRESRQNITIKF